MAKAKRIILRNEARALMNLLRRQAPAARKARDAHGNALAWPDLRKATVCQAGREKEEC